MKKMFFIICLIILIPYFVVSIFFVEDKNKFFFSSNMTVKVKREATGTIDSVPFEDYVLGVLAGEMPISFENEALKAQAVAARSYVLRKMQSTVNESYNVVDTVMNQVYLDRETLKNKWGNNFNSYYDKLKTVIDDTKGEYLEYNGEIVNAMFFSTSSGSTENSEEIFVSALPYLRSVDSHWDSVVSPVFNDDYEFSLADFYTKLNLNYSDNLNIDVLKKTSGGSVKEIKINGNIFTGRQIASALKLRSSNFELAKNGSNVTITSKGYGHGVGMSQYGALGMALEGYKYTDILKHYYSNVEIKKI